MCASVLLAGGLCYELQTADRTTPLLQKMDATQQAHSRLYDHLRDDEKPFRSRVRFLDRDEDAVETSDDIFDAGAEPRAFSDVVRDLACGAGAVFTGTVLGAASFPIADGTFLFTDYTVVMQDVLRPGHVTALQSGQRTIVTRLGGRVEIDGRTRRAIAVDLPLLQEGRQYLFFVKYLPATRDFEANQSTSAFLVDGRRVRPLLSRDEYIFRQTGGMEPAADAVTEEVRNVKCH